MPGYCSSSRSARSIRGEELSMAREGLSLGGSLPVPNVQALAATVAGDLAAIPHRYIRPDMGEEADEDGAGGIPVIDLGLLLGDPFSGAEEAAKLRRACEDWGFFQLVNHGVPEELMGRMAAALEEFFALPLEEKMASSRQPAGSVEGYGQAFVVSGEQKLDWSDMLFLVTQPLHLRNLGLWPTHPPTFRTTLEEYSMETKRVALILLGRMAENLGLTPEKLTSCYTDGRQGIRMNYYPPCQHHADRVLGISPHSDGSGLTLLFQPSSTPGLQIRRNGRWLTVEPLPGAFIVNVGDILEIMSNGNYKSIEHRAVVDRERRRLSMATFYSPNMDGFVGPLKDLVGDGRPLYRTLTTEEYFRQRLSNKLQGKKFLDSMKLMK